MSRKVLLFVFQLFFFLSLNYVLNCQVVPPYEQNFENLDQIDWTHYSTFGSDNWEIGPPIGAVLDEALSGENTCATNLDGNVSQNSFMCLETPEFDLSGSVNWVLSFSHQYYTYAGAGGNIEYSIDGGANWILLNGSNTEKRSWYNTENVAVLGQSGWSGSNYNSGFVVSSHDLGFLSGQSSVKFRFKYGSGYYTYEGWVIDDFKIVEECNNIYAISGDITHASQIFTSFIVNTNLIYDGIVRPAFQNTIEYYFSYDEIWDENDSLIGTKVGNMYVTSSNWEKTFDMIPNLSHGDYYIFKKLDINDNLEESNEDDNLSYSILRVDSTFVGMHKDNFESGSQYWNNYAKNSSYTYIGPGIWTFGNNNLHHIFGAHSGSNAWYVNDTYSLFGSNSMHYIESPFLDLTDTANYTFCFWYKLMSRSEYSGNITIQTANTGIYPFYSTSFTGNTTILNTFRINDWDCSCTDVSHLSGKENAKVRVAYKHLETYYSNHIIVIDDVYIGPALPDLKIEDDIVRTFNSLAESDTLFYTIFNAGMFPVESSVTRFYWSADSIYDPDDVLLGETLEPSIPETSFLYREFGFDLPTTEPGDYFILAITDANEEISEMWENDIAKFEIKLQDNKLIPYFNDFETTADGWFHNNLFGEDEWEHGQITGLFLDSTVLGDKSLFAYSADSLLAQQSLMLLYTPKFDLSGVENPVLEFDMELEDRFGYQNSSTVVPYMNLSYSYDNGDTWHVLDTTSQSFKAWYYYMYYNPDGGTDLIRKCATQNYYLFDTEEPYFANSHLYHGRDSRRLYKHIIDIDTLQCFGEVQFRYNLTTRKNNMGKGVIIDNFSIKDGFTDLSVEYDKDLIKSPLSNYISVIVDICNNGNIVSELAHVNFYLSTDQIKDDSDVLCGRDYIPPIRPDCCYNLNYLSEDTLQLEGYNYLIIYIDEENVIGESNTENNIVVWSLSPNGITDYPYLLEFEDTVFDGWSYYSYRYSNVLTRDRWRIRSFPAQNEALYITGIVAGELFTDPCNGVLTSTPRFNLETPNFNFTLLENIRLSFDFSCFPGTGYGGNVSYSTDGGQNWTILLDQYGDATGWYLPTSSVQSLYNVPGWTGAYQPWSNRSINVSFLQGQPSVVFKYQFIAHGGNGGSFDGMRIDNFQITGDTVIINDIDKFSDYSVSVYPNPASDFINIWIDSPDVKSYTISIFDLAGKEIISTETINEKSLKISTSSLQPGCYFVELGGDLNLTKRLIVR